MRSPKIECIVAQHPWLENDCLYADIILPTNTTLEVNDIMLNLRDGDSFQSVLLMRKAIEPIGESKSDYEAVCAVAEKMGMLDEVTDGFSEAELIKGVFDGMGFDKIVSWEEFQEKEYFVVPYEKDWQKHTAGWYDFYKDPRSNPHPHAHRQAGVLVGEPGRSTSPTTPSVRPSPKWIEKGITHDERISSYAGEGLSAAGHVQPRPVEGPRPVRRHPLDQGDGHRQDQGLGRLLVRAVLDAPQRRCRRGASRTATSSRCTTSAAACCAAPWCGSASCRACSRSTTARGPTSSSRGKLDRGGAINAIAPEGLTSKHAGGQATSGYLAEVERVTHGSDGGVEDETIPRPSSREYDPASGLRFNAWVEEGR